MVPGPGAISLIWVLVRNVSIQGPLRPTELDTFEVGPKKSILITPPGNLKETKV